MQQLSEAEWRLMSIDDPNSLSSDINNANDDKENHIDGCLCDLEIDESDLISDAELPATSGGVEPGRADFEDDADIDGCDVDFDRPDITPDEELPVATGGVFATTQPADS